MTDIVGSGATLINSELVEGAPAYRVIGDDNLLINQNGGIIRGLNEAAIRLVGYRNRILNEAGARIEATSGNALIGSDHQDTVENAGLMVGGVDLGGGSDTFVQDGGNYTAQVNLGSGDDFLTVRREPTNFYFTTFNGGSGFDTLRLDSPTSNYMRFTGFERIIVRELAHNENYYLSLRDADIQEIALTGPASGAGFVQANGAALPNATLLLSRVSLSLGPDTSVKAVLGTDAVDFVSFTGSVSVLSGVSLRGGDDSVTLTSFQNIVTQPNGVIDGGAGIDSISFTSAADATLNLGQFVNFETLSVGVNFSPNGEHRILNLPDLQSVLIAGSFNSQSPGRLVIEASDRPNVAIRGSGYSQITVQADSRVGKVVDRVTEPQGFGTASAQIVINHGVIAGDVDLRGESDIVRNGNRIDGSVLLGDGGDRYTETSANAVVLGLVDGGAGTDRFDLVTGHSRTGLSFNGGDGADLVSFSTASAPIILKLNENIALDGSIALSLLNFENGAGSGFNDLLIGSAAANRLEGLGGNDRIEGLNADDLLFGGDGEDVLLGGQGADALDGGSGNDQLNGGDGADLLSGGAGDDAMDGGEDFDRAQYSVFFRTVGVGGVGASVSVTAAAEGTDTFTSVEQIIFRDGTLVSDANSAGAKAIRLYDTVLGRTPDKVGLDFYVDRLEDRGMPLVAVANELANSPEFQQVTGGLNNSQFVDYVYEHALRRAADPGGKAFYTERLNAGAMTRGDFVVDLSESAEHRSLTADVVAQGYFNTDDNYQSVALFYDSFLDRLPDSGGLIFYGERLKSGAMTIGQVAADFAGSNEFSTATAGMTNDQLVDHIYINALNRGPDAGGRSFYINQLDNGMSRAAFVQEISHSQEHYNLLANIIIDGIQLG